MGRWIFLWLALKLVNACNPYNGAYSFFRLSSASDCTGFHALFTDMELRFHQKSSGVLVEMTVTQSSTPCEVVIFQVPPYQNAQIQRITFEGSVGKVYRLECGYLEWLYTNSWVEVYMTQATQQLYCNVGGCFTVDSNSTTDETDETSETSSTVMTTEPPSTPTTETSTSPATTSDTTASSSSGSIESTTSQQKELRCNPFHGIRYLRLSSCGAVYSSAGSAGCNVRWDPKVQVVGRSIRTSRSSGGKVRRDGELSADRPISTHSVWWNSGVYLGCSCWNQVTSMNATVDLFLPGDFSVTKIEITQGDFPIYNLCLDCFGLNDYSSPANNSETRAASSLQLELSRLKTVIQCNAVGCIASQEPPWVDPHCERGDAASSSESQGRFWSAAMFLCLAAGHFP